MTLAYISSVLFITKIGFQNIKNKQISRFFKNNLNSNFLISTQNIDNQTLEKLKRPRIISTATKKKSVKYA